MKYDEKGMPLVRDPQTGELVSAVREQRDRPQSFGDVLSEAKKIIRACDEADKKGHSKTVQFKADDILAGSIGAGRAQKSRVPGLEDALVLDRKLRNSGM